MAKYTKQEKSWMFYDWATSAFSIIIATAIFPIYYKAVAENAGVSNANADAFWSYSVSIATFILALFGPILGTIADYKGYKKKLFIFFLMVGVLATAGMALPIESWIFLLIMYVLAEVGSSGSGLFYNAFLVDVTEEKRMNEISSRGYAIGYIGSVIPFVLCIALIILAQQKMIPISTASASQLSFLITALWWGLFTIPLLKNVHQVYYVEREPKIIANSFRRLGNTFKEIRKYRNIFLFLIAYFFYIDGVGTIISLAAVYGTSVGLDSNGLLIALLAVQIVAAPFAILFGKLSGKFGTKKMIYVGIIIYTFVCFFALFLDTLLEFWILAMLVATSQGGIQALSRSYFAQMVPKEKSNEFFGFYNIFGKFAAVLGPFLFGITAQLTGNSSFGVFSIVILFIIGFFMLMIVPDHEAKTIKAEGSFPQGG